MPPDPSQATLTYVPLRDGDSLPPDLAVTCKQHPEVASFALLPLSWHGTLRGCLLLGFASPAAVSPPHLAPYSLISQTLALGLAASSFSELVYIVAAID